jgi:hypothetical protein
MWAWRCAIASVMVLAVVPQGASAAGPARSLCIDSRHRLAYCDGDPSFHVECLAAEPQFGRCPGDAICHDPSGRQIRCDGLMLVTARCRDGYLTAELNRDGACRNHGGVETRFTLPPRGLWENLFGR